jgi:hypothetical protein
MKNIFVKIIFAILCIIVIGISVSCFLNHQRLMNLAHQLSTFPIPNETVVLEQQSVSGHMTGQGDGTDYLTVLLVKSSLTMEKLQEYYQGPSFKTILSASIIRKLRRAYGEAVGKEENEYGIYPVDIYVNHVDKTELTDIKGFDLGDSAYDMPLNKDLTFKTLNGIEDYSNYYYIMLYDNGYPEYLDISLLNAVLQSWFD